MYVYIYVYIEYIYIYSIHVRLLAVLLCQETAVKHGKFTLYVNKSKEDSSESLDIYAQY